MEYYLSIITFTFVAGITPGPNNLMLMTSGLNHGIQKSLPHYFGICLGFPLMVLVMGFGMGEIFSAFPGLYFYLKIAGITYLLYLSWKIANAGNPNADKKVRDPFTFMQAAIFQWLNPKAWVIAVGALAAFTTSEKFTEGVITVMLVYLFMGFFCMGLWLKLGQALQQFLGGGIRIKYFNITMAVLLVLSITPMAFADEVYKQVDDTGKVIFTDEPLGEAEKIIIKDTNLISGPVDILYRESCSAMVLKSRICSVKILDKRSDFAMLRIQYHYVKGEEHSNTMVVKANKGTHDNIVGTRGGFSLVEGQNTIDIPFGLYRSGVYKEANPYMSKYIVVKAQGIAQDGKRFTRPPIFEHFIKYEHPWYAEGDKVSW